ncbi:SpoIIIAH-like family protein [Clostridium sediminicola]|uniref:SpoIIIAH-like family protein n=1 Tax=Clostridium sediminicola TaxID=3114879 RepID=UPI0031F2204E
MSKKQGAIIVVLLALIISAGILATKLNNDSLYVGKDLNNDVSSISTSQTETTTSSNFFAEQKIIRDNKENQILQNLKTLIDDENISEEERQKTSSKYTELTMASNSESEIETLLKAKGYAEALCFVEENKVRIIIKSPEKLTDQQLKQIQDVVVDVTKIMDVDISQKE